MEKIDAAEFKKVIDFAYMAHQERAMRHPYRQGGRVPFTVHPLWCAMMLLQDTKVPFEQRVIGYQALLLHDVLEDTAAELPDFVSDEVKEAVQDMTYNSWEEEREAVPHKSSFIKLLKLYDKVATIYDEGVSEPRRPEWRALTEELVRDVEHVYGPVRIVVVAKTVLNDIDW